MIDWVLGVDPGLKGALAFLYITKHSKERLLIYDVPVLEVKRGRKAKHELDRHSLDEILSGREHEPVVAFVERASAMPGQGVTSMFSFGVTYGSLLQAIVSNGIALEHVRPIDWRKALSVRKGKDGSRLRASELMPDHAELWSLKKHHGRAEAALIAYYGAVQRGLVRTRRRLGARPTG